MLAWPSLALDIVLQGHMQSEFFISVVICFIFQCVDIKIAKKERLVLQGILKKEQIFKLLEKLNRFVCIWFMKNTKNDFIVVKHFNHCALDVANKFNWCIVEVISNIKRYATRASLRLFSRVVFNRLISTEFIFLTCYCLPSSMFLSATTSRF